MTKTTITAPDTPSARLQAAKARFDVAQAEADAAAAILREAEVAWFWTELLAANESFMAAADGVVSTFRRLNACAEAIKRRGGHPIGNIDVPALALFMARHVAHDVRACATAERTSADRAIVERDMHEALNTLQR
ncbi:MAG: hypothetical protein OZ924_15660 [Burkholderiaceae bacterium]|nr:hypothetical protein [Burkholderiaceae bacterium]